MNPRYRAWVASRYAPLFQAVADATNPGGFVVEAGAGAGFTACALRPYLTHTTSLLLLEKDPEMVDLCAEQVLPLDRTMVVQSDILRDPLVPADCIYAHGVLEHYDDRTINRMVSRQRQHAPAVVHYVPTDRYDSPSFGDERLMSPAAWQRIAKPTRMVEFNDGYDLLLVWEQA